MTAAVAITFDNLGEASDLERGRWPADEPLGEHESVTRALPPVLELLAEHGLAATFFVEGLNAELYPDALREVAAAGHEVALHGWRHEPWSELDPDRERALLTRSVDALARLGLDPAGFRPPGGMLAPSSWEALPAAGFSYCSPAGSGAGVRDGLAVLPFAWPQIDAFHYLPHFAARRTAARGAPDLLDPAALRSTLAAALRAAIARGALLTLLFHPFLADTPERLAVLRAVLRDVRTAVHDGSLECAPMRDVAERVATGGLPGAGRLVLDES